jgi:phosphatidylglycerophosphatase C
VTVVAAFDVDGTLTTGDCVVPFLRRFVRWSAAPGILRSSPAAAAALARRDRDSLKALATGAVLSGIGIDAVEQEAERFAGTVVARKLRGDTTARLRWHLGEGHRVVLVSASYEVYLRHLAAHLGVHDVLATRLEVGADGRLTGQLDGGNCRGPEKARRLEAWLAAKPDLDRQAVELWAYGDSAGDAELLAMADRGIWAGERLASVAPT